MSAINELDLILNNQQELEFNFNNFLIAVKSGNTQYVKQTIQNQQCNIALHDSKNKTALTYALEAGYITIAKLLINTNQMKIDSLSCNETYLIQSLEIGAIDLIELLIQKGANVNLRDKNGSSALLIALKNEYFEIAKLLLANDADINIRNNDGWTPLIWASLQGDEDTIKFLLDNGANVNMKNNDGWNAMVAAYFKGFTNIVSLLSEKKAIFSSTHAEMAMILAYEEGNISIVEKLIKQGINVNIKTKDNRFFTALVIENEDKELMKLLLAHGANIHNIPKNNPILKNSSDTKNEQSEVSKNKNHEHMTKSKRPSLLYRAYAKSY